MHPFKDPTWTKLQEILEHQDQLQKALSDQNLLMALSKALPPNLPDLVSPLEQLAELGVKVTENPHDVLAKTALDEALCQLTQFQALQDAVNAIHSQIGSVEK